MESLRILIMNYMDAKHPGAGGSEVFTQEVARRWVKLGHEVTLMCAKFNGAMDRDEIDGVEVLRSGGRYTVYLKAKKVYEKIFKGKIDIAIDEINTIPFFTPRYLKEPKIALIHQLAREILFYELPLPVATLGYFLELRMLRTYNEIPIVTVSKSSKDSLIDAGIPAKNIHIVSQGIDHECYKPSKDKRNDPLIAYVGWLKKYKRVNDLLKSIKYVAKQLPEVKLMLASKSKGKSIAELKRWITKLALQDNVVFLGPISKMEKLVLLSHVQVLVYTSVREGFGLPILEGAACRTPAIAYDVPGLRDAVLNGITGLLTPYRDVKALANAITKILTDEALRKSLSENAYKWSFNFSWDKTATQFMDLIKKYTY